MGQVVEVHGVKGIVRYVGKVHFADGVWVGVKLESPGLFVHDLIAFYHIFCVCVFGVYKYYVTCNLNFVLIFWLGGEGSEKV